jgi:Flp pilus assembly protein TadB
MNQPVEQLLYEFAMRSGCEDIVDFAEIFCFAKRSGGNFVKIVQSTAWHIAEKQAVEREVATVLSGKKMEQKIMNVVPILLLLLPVVFILAAVITLIVALVQSNRRMKQSQKMFNDIWNQRMGDAQGRDAAQNPVADMLNNPFQTFNRVFESVTQQIEADNRAPQLQVNARVLSRRQSFYRSSVGAQHSSTSHYITFEL